MTTLSLNTVSTAVRNISQSAKPAINTIAQKIESTAPQVTEKLQKIGFMDTLKGAAKLVKSYGKQIVDFAVKYGQKAWGGIKVAAEFLMKLFQKAPKA